MTAILIKHTMVSEEEFSILEVFLSHNYGDLMKAFYEWHKEKKDVMETITSPVVNIIYKKYFGSCYEVSTDKMIDYNYVVDCLEDEHIKRDVVTTRTVAETSNLLGAEFNPNYQPPQRGRPRKYSDNSA